MRLTYFDVPQRPQLANFVLEQAGAEYEDNGLSPTGDTWKAFKPSEVAVVVAVNCCNVDIGVVLVVVVVYDDRCVDIVVVLLFIMLIMMLLLLLLMMGL